MNSTNNNYNYLYHISFVSVKNKKKLRNKRILAKIYKRIKLRWICSNCNIQKRVMVTYNIAIN